MRSIPVLLAGSLAACAHRASTPAPAAAAADAGWPPQQPWTAALEADLQAGDLDSARALLDAQLAVEQADPEVQADLLWTRGYVHYQQGRIDEQRADVRALLSLADAGAFTSPPPGLQQLLGLAALVDVAAGAELRPEIAGDMAHAVPVIDIGMEYLFISQVRCGPALTGVYESAVQALLYDEEGHAYDMLDCACTAGDQTREFYFQIDGWMSYLGGLLEGGGGE
ncbi:MAG: hypothetical protein ABIO70_19770 [Pseudomonadota bacterium]